MSLPLPAATKKGKGKTTVYKYVPDPDGTLAEMAAQYKKDKEAFEAADASCKNLRPRLIRAALPFWCSINNGKLEAEHVAIHSPEGEVLAVAVDKYAATDKDQIIQAVGPDILQRHFYNAMELKVSGENLPANQKTLELLTKTVELFREYGLEGAIEFKQVVKPNKGWKNDRHRVLSVEQNIQLEAVCPMVVQLKTKGRGE